MTELSRLLLLRLSSRVGYVLVFAVVALGLMIAGPLTFGAAFAGLLAFAGIIVALPGHVLNSSRLGRQAGAGRLAARAGRSADKPRELPVSLAVHAFPEPVVTVALDGTVLTSNHACRDLFAGIAEGRPISAALRDPDFGQALANTAASRKPAVLTFGERVPISRSIKATIVPLLNEDAEPEESQFKEQIMIVFHDLTAREALDQMRTDFIANASHELRTPLASVSGFIETLRGAAQDDAAARAKFLDIMSKQTERMARLINDLMSLSRVEMNAHLFPTDKVDLRSVLVELREAMQQIADDVDVKLSLKLDDETDLTVRGERDELLQVFQNLIQNGIKYGSANGRVEISGRVVPTAEAAQVVVCVSDDGVGIAADDLPRLTERFYRVNAAASREKGGTGLGLAIVKHIVRRHRGELKVRSTLGEGSEFEVILPSL